MIIHKTRNYIFPVLLFFILSGLDFINTSPYTLYVFEGSDWCSNCRRLENTVLAKEEFLDFLSKREIAIHKIDFPQRIKQSKEEKKINAAIAELYAFDGSFPTLILAKTNAQNFEKVFYSNQSVSQMQQQIIDKLKLLQ
ncbi:MAG: thioredoxin family protein [Cyclobacteriaceae bacterium]|nr:thioredoxin family protein [Cyclobacteriaceae bacterium]